MSEQENKRGRAELAAKVAELEGQVTSQRRMINLMECLLAILVFEACKGQGDVWRVVFTPKLIEMGKRFQLKIDAGANALLPHDFMMLAADTLKLDLSKLSSSLEDMEALRKMIDPAVIKKTFVVTSEPKPTPDEKTLRLAEELARKAEGVDQPPPAIVIDPAKLSGNELIKNFRVESMPLPPEEQKEVEREGRGRMRYCEKCQGFYLGQIHACTPNGASS